MVLPHALVVLVDLTAVERFCGCLFIADSREDGAENLLAQGRSVVTCITFLTRFSVPLIPITAVHVLVGAYATDGLRLREKTR
jgi:hypothetical protein